MKGFDRNQLKIKPSDKPAKYDIMREVRSAPSILSHLENPYISHASRRIELQNAERDQKNMISKRTRVRKVHDYVPEYIDK